MWRIIIQVIFVYGLIAAIVGKNPEGSDGRGCTFKYFEDAKSYSDALSSCQSYGGTLAIPDTSLKMAYLKQLLKSAYPTRVGYYIIGGKESNTNKVYNWEGGAPVNTASYNGFTSTSNKGDKYMFVRVEGNDIWWATTSTNKHFICQKIDTTSCSRTCSGHGTCKQTNIYDCHQSWCQCYGGYYGSNCEYEKPKISSCSIARYSTTLQYPVNITCDVTGKSIPTIKWTVNGANAVNNSADIVFVNTMKTSTSLTATLTLKRAVCLEVTKIRITTWNSYQTYKDVEVNSIYNTIINMTTNTPECDGLTTTLRWSSNVPDHLQQKLQYEIATTPETITSLTSSISYNFTSLTPETLYEARVKTIAGSAACLGGFDQHSTLSFTTGFGRPQAVYTNVTYKDDYECQIMWSFSSKNITAIKIFITGTTNMIGLSGSYSTYKENVTIDSVKRIDAWRRSMLPNKNYTFQIQGINCAGEGDVKQIEQSCITPTTAPYQVPPVSFVSTHVINGQINVTIPMISEENGSISCVLVFVTNETKLTGNTSLTHAQVVEMTSERGYVAYCVKDVSKPSIITLGNGEDTYCEVERSTSMERSANGTTTKFTGTNKELDLKMNGLLLITITNSHDGILYRRNELTFIRPASINDVTTHTPNKTTLAGQFIKPESSNCNYALTAVVASLITLVATLLIGCVIIWFMRKNLLRASKNTCNQNHSTLDNVGRETTYENIKYISKD